MPQTFDKEDLKNFNEVQNVNYIHCECNRESTGWKFQSLGPHCVEKSLEPPAKSKIIKVMLNTNALSCTPLLQMFSSSSFQVIQNPALLFILCSIFPLAQKLLPFILHRIDKGSPQLKSSFTKELAFLFFFSFLLFWGWHNNISSQQLAKNIFAKEQA